MKTKKIWFLPLILAFYAILYIATQYEKYCDPECEAMGEFNTSITNNRNYVEFASRCIYNKGRDSICILVRDTTGVDWNRFADTSCMIANQVGLSQQTVIIIRFNTTGARDTVAVKVCP